MRCIDQSHRSYLRKTLASAPFLMLEDGAKHARVRNSRTNDWIPIAGSSSDRRAAKNFEAALRKLTMLGQGFVFAKTGHLPRH